MAAGAPVIWTCERRRYDLMDVVIPVNQPLLWVEETGDPREVEFTKARLDFTARKVELPTKTLSFVDVHALWKAIQSWGG